MDAVDPEGLSEAERSVWDGFPRGVVIDFRDTQPRPPIRAAVIRALLLGARPAEPGHLAGLRLVGALVTGRLDLSYVEVAGPVQMEECEFDSVLDLYGARTRQLSLSGCSFPGLTASTAVVDGNLRLNRCRSTGELRLVSVRVTGSVLLAGANLTGPEFALHATQLSVGNDLLAQDLVCSGEMRLNNAEIGGRLRLERAQLTNPGGTALSAVEISVGTVANCCEGFQAVGGVRFTHARIKSQLCFERATLSKPGGTALNCRNLSTDILRLLPDRIEGGADLRHAQIGVLHDSPATWPTPLLLDGLRYDRLADPGRAAQRLRWLRLDPDGYLPQTYQQLAESYRRLGRDGDGRRVLLAKQRHLRELFSPLGKLWGYLQDLTVGYGFRPVRAAIWLVALLTLGTVVFGLHPPRAVRGIDAPVFNSFVYTLDLLLPIIDFGQEESFNPRGSEAWLAYGLIAAGWLLATTIAAGATRILRRE